MTTIDIVVPSYRVESRFLLGIIGLKVPDRVQVRYIIVIDNPKISLPDALLPFTTCENIVFLHNEQNSGASRSRNRGIDHCTAEWILFLDDDIRPVPDLLFAYAEAIRQFPEAVGFFGETVFPEPVNSFTHGLVAGDMLYAFAYARYNDEARWATTSNVIVRRNAVGDIRFREHFPRKGGGEDYAFFLEVYERCEKTLRSVKGAVVYHNWWHNGKRNYHQYIRWAVADYQLFKMFPQITHYDYPNIGEMLLISFLAGTAGLLSGLPFIFVLCIFSGIVFGEILVESFRLYKTKGLYGLRYAGEVILIKTIADISRMTAIVKHMDFKFLFRRPNYSSVTVHSGFFYWSRRKFFAYIFISALLVTFFLQL